MIKGDLSQGCKDFFNICKLISVIHHINELNNKNHTIISVNEEKVSDKIQYPFMTKKKPLHKVGTEGTHLNIIQVIHDKL